MLSPLDFRLSCYLMAMFNFNHELISYLNTFNDITKDRYLSYTERPSKNLSIVKYRSYKNYKFRLNTMHKMPDYCKNKDLGEYWLECTRINEQVTF